MNTTTIDTQVSVPFVISNLSRDVAIVAHLSAVSDGGGIADVPSMSLSLTLPDGLTFTSASGVFLTQPPGEPAPGASPVDPVMPCTLADGTFAFGTLCNTCPAERAGMCGICPAGRGCWYDPPFVEGFTYTLEGGATFTEVAPPQLPLALARYTSSWEAPFWRPCPLANIFSSPLASPRSLYKASLPS